MPIVFAILTFISTLLGGLVGLRYKDKLHLILGFTAGVLLAVVAFDVFPEIITLTTELHIDPIHPMTALVIGFMAFHILEKSLLIHHTQEDNYGEHKHPTVGIASALAFIGHSFLDGIGIGLGFQVSPAVGLFVAIAVISHDFSDGLNTVTLALVHKNTRRKAIYLLLMDAIAPVVGIFSTRFFTLSNEVLILYLGFFAGFLLYIGISDILPEAHSKHSSFSTIAMTIFGILFIYAITQIA